MLNFVDLFSVFMSVLYTKSSYKVADIQQVLTIERATLYNLFRNLLFIYNTTKNIKLCVKELLKDRLLPLRLP